MNSGFDVPEGQTRALRGQAFGARPFDEVTVADLAAAANVTTGALYHHFGSKLGLYAFVRADVERRLLDRMEGAVAAAGPDRSTAITTRSPKARSRGSPAPRSRP